MLRSSILSLALLAPLCAVAPPALAESPAGDKQSRIVSFHDLDLTVAADRARFERRLENAANLVCGVWNAKQLNAKRSATACKADALAKAQPAVTLAMSEAVRGRAERDAR
jgi:UrcA family protein